MRRRPFKWRRSQLAERLARSLPRPLHRLADRWLEHREIRRILKGAEEAKRRAVALSTPCEEGGVAGVAVAVKNRMYENWLVSDPQALRSMSARFRLTTGQVRSVSNDRADSVDGLRLLKRIAQGKAYGKVADAVEIMGRADALRMASNSRSFRRFLRVIGHPSYASQSARP